MNESNLKFVKLRKGHLGHEQFQFYATVNGKRNNWINYLMLRNLCREIWGDSCDRALYESLARITGQEVNPHWAWHTDINNGQYRIYLKSEKERMWVSLVW